jgi:DNA-binding response OmpR family regulator
VNAFTSESMGRPTLCPELRDRRDDPTDNARWPRMPLWDRSTVYLPPREIAALLALASRPGEGSPRSNSARRIWPGTALVGPYDLRGVIHRLRTLPRSGSAPFEVRTLRGRATG